MPAVRAIARRNLLEHELLLLAVGDDLPVRYEKLRHAAQSYGKTREKNWEELRRGSMRDRLNWLAKNYPVLCRIEKLQLTTPFLARLGQWFTWGMLLPLPLLLAAVAFVTTVGVRGRLLGEDHLGLMFAALALMVGSAMIFAFAKSTLMRIEQAALYAELVEQLDTDLAPMPAAVKQLP